MDLKAVLDTYHQQIVNSWVHFLLSDLSSRYAEEPGSELRRLVNRAALAFKSAIIDNNWKDLRHFINFIAKKRFDAGFKLSEVQKAFELYRQIVTPLLLSNIKPTDLPEVLLRFHSCMVITVTSFSEHFQNLHEHFLRNQNLYLEREITSRTKALAESERKYKTLVEDINDGYFVLIQGKIVFVNKAFSEMHGRSLTDITGSSYLDFVAPESQEIVKQTYEESQQDRLTSLRVEYLRLHRDGRRLSTEIMAKISTYSGELATIGICRDISQRVELERKTREAEKLNALAQLSASLAHEIRNSLTAIKMNAQMLSSDKETHPTRQRLMAVTLKEIEQIERTVVEMMEITIPFRLQFQKVPVHPLLKGCLEMLQQRMENKTITVSLRLSPKVTEIWVDPHRLEQALVNLLFNAIAVLPQGGQIFLSTQSVHNQGQGWDQIKISDNGPGLPKEMLPYLFDPFFSHKVRGTGLGLGNVKKIVEAHGGKVLVTLRRPKGVTITLQFPEGSDL